MPKPEIKINGFEPLNAFDIFEKAVLKVNPEKQNMSEAVAIAKDIRIVLSSDSEGNSYDYARSYSFTTDSHGNKVLVLYPRERYMDEDMFE